MKILSILALAISLTILLNCKPDVNYTEGKTKSAYPVYYFKDTRTNLCFAWNGENSHSWTNVPCTKEVEDLIK